MTKLMSIVAATALALSMSCVALAANEKIPDDRPNIPKTPDETGVPADQTKQDQEYLAALKKCEGLQEAAKQQCIDQVRQQHNRM